MHAISRRHAIGLLGATAASVSLPRDALAQAATMQSWPLRTAKRSLHGSPLATCMHQRQ